MTRASLRWIFLVPILVTIIVGFGGFAFYADRIERNNRLADLDAELVRAEQRNGADDAPAPGRPLPRPSQDPAAQQEAGPPEGTESPDEVTSADADDDTGDPVQLLIDPGGRVTSVGPSGNPFSEDTIEYLRTIDGFGTATKENYRVLVGAQDPQVTVVTALSLDLVDEAARDFRRSVALGGSIIVALVALVVWMLVRALTRPIIRITAVANRIANGELDTDLDVPTRSHELADLTSDLDKMIGQLRATLEQSEQSAADATEARDDMQRFLADMAHELRTPLTALKGYSDLHAGGMLESNGAVDRAMSRIGSESERLYRLVDDMLQLARTGSFTEPTEIVDVAATAEAVVADLQAANPDGVLRLAVSEGDHHITGTASRIHQALLNLGANACDHSEPGDEVLITVDSNATSVRARVIDKGSGVSENMRDQVFLPFFRDDSSRSRQGHGGAGLGLALTKQIADLHRGTIEVESTPGGGATFVLSIPVHSA